MYSRNLFVLDFVRRFFVSCVQISEAYAVRTLTGGKSATKASAGKTPRVHFIKSNKKVSSHIFDAVLFYFLLLIN